MKESKIKILHIDDSPYIRISARKILERTGYIVLEAENGLDGIKKAVENLPNLILLDINMPEMDGEEVATRLKSLQQLETIPIVALTAATGDDAKEKALMSGCDGYIAKPIDKNSFPLQIKEFLEGKREIINNQQKEVQFLKQHSQKLVEKLEGKIRELTKKNILLETLVKEREKNVINIMNSLMKALEEKDVYTAGHSERVIKYSLDIGSYMQLSEKKLQTLERAAKLHDIGKLVIELSYINKKGPLTIDEWSQMTRHPVVGASILQPLDFLEEEVFLVKHHHEKWDGTGYPDGLKGQELGLLTSILVIADSYDAMISERSYKKQFAQEDALNELIRCRGTHFSPNIVDIFVNKLREQIRQLANA